MSSTAVTDSFTPGPISSENWRCRHRVKCCWVFFYFRFPLLRTVVGSLQTSPLYRQISFSFFSLFCPKLPSSFFFSWHLTLYGRLPKILAPKFAKYVLSSSIVLISVFGHVVDPERKAPILLFSLSAAVN